MYQNDNTRTVLLEFNKGLNIQSCQTWLKKYTGERTVCPVAIMGRDGNRYTKSAIKTPTLKKNGFKVVYEKVWGEVAKWPNKDIVVYVMKKRNISTKSEILYNITKEPFSTDKSVQIFYKNP